MIKLQSAIEMQLRVPENNRSELAVPGPAERKDWRSVVSPFYIAVQLFSPQSREYSESASTSMHVRIGQWQTIEMPLPQRTPPDGPLRLDPGDARGLIEIAELQLCVPGAPEPLWSSGDWSKTPITIAGTAMRLPSQDVLTVLSYGNDPIVVLPDLAGLPGTTLLRVRMRVQIGESIFAASIPLALTAPKQAAQMLNSLEADGEQARTIIRTLACQLADVQHDRTRALAELESFRLELDRDRSTLDRTRAEAQEQAARILELDQDLAGARSQLTTLHTAVARLETDRNLAQAAHKFILASWSWRLSAPLRLIGSFFVRR
jgi:hypothetical protein